MSEARDDRYRRRYQNERNRADHYRDLALALAALAEGVDLDEFLNEEDRADVARRRATLRSRSG
jgi:hypothetical protein